MEEWKKKIRKLGDKCFEGEVTVPKSELWLVLISCFLMGILYGLKHGVMIGSDNGNSLGCCTGRKRSAKAGKAEEESQKDGKEACGDGRGEERHKCHKKSRCCCRNR